MYERIAQRGVIEDGGATRSRLGSIAYITVMRCGPRRCGHQALAETSRNATITLLHKYLVTMFLANTTGAADDTRIY